MPTAADIRKLRNMCLRLRDLTLDIHWELPGWPKETLTALMSSEELSYLRLVVQKSPREFVNNNLLFHRGKPVLSEAAQTLAFDYITNSRENIVIEFAQRIDGHSAAVKPYQHTHALCRDDLGSV